MYQTLQEALEANSLEHKLEMQIKATLASEEKDINEAAEYIVKLNKKFNKKVFNLEIPESIQMELDQFLKKYLNVGLNELDKLNYATIRPSDSVYFITNFSISPSNKYIDGYKWYSTSRKDDISLNIYRYIPNNTFFGIFRVPPIYRKRVIIGQMKELAFDFTK